jgi:hypothetical protein
VVNFACVSQPAGAITVSLSIYQPDQFANQPELRVSLAIVSLGDALGRKQRRTEIIGYSCSIMYNENAFDLAVPCN